MHIRDLFVLFVPFVLFVAKVALEHLVRTKE